MTTEPDQERHLLATVLRDLSVAAAMFEQSPTADNRKLLNAANDNADVVLADFVEREGDIRVPAGYRGLA